MQKASSRERMLRSLNIEPVDRVPCCFMSFAVLRNRCQGDRYETVKAERAMGLDAMLFIPTASRAERPEHPDLRGLPVRFHPSVEVREWREALPGGSGVLHKEYVTPAGKLATSVRLSPDWPHGNHIPFVDDYQIPRALGPLVSGPDDLERLDYLLIPPSPTDVASFAQEAQKAHAFAAEHDVLLAGGWGVGLDMANWLCGMQNLMVLSMEEPEFVAALLERIHVWNVRRMKVVLSAPVDLYIRRAWYEGCDFCTPRFYRDVVMPQLRAEAELAHRCGAKFGYICSSGAAPMLDSYLEAGVDVLIGVDPVQGTHTDMALFKRRVGDRICLWGGVSGAVTVERGSDGDVRAAVREALDALGPTGFVLSPVDNITVDAPRTWRNIDILIDEWMKRA